MTSTPQFDLNLAEFAKWLRPIAAVAKSPFGGGQTQWVRVEATSFMDSDDGMDRVQFTCTDGAIIFALRASAAEPPYPIVVRSGVAFVNIQPFKAVLLKQATNAPKEVTRISFQASPEPEFVLGRTVVGVGGFEDGVQAAAMLARVEKYTQNFVPPLPHLSSGFGHFGFLPMSALLELASLDRNRHGVGAGLDFLFPPNPMDPLRFASPDGQVCGAVMPQRSSSLDIAEGSWNAALSAVRKPND